MITFTEFDDTFFGPELVNGIAIVETESITMNPYNTTLPDHYHKHDGKESKNTKIWSFSKVLFQIKPRTMVEEPKLTLVHQVWLKQTKMKLLDLVVSS